MKVVKLRELCDVAPGTVFSEWQPAVATGLHIFHSRVSDVDFFYSDMIPGPNEEFNQPECQVSWLHRWGLFDEDSEFAVFEQAELAELISALVQAQAGVVVSDG